MKKVLALIVLCFIAFNSPAQLKYQNGSLVYNAMERYNGYMTNWEGWAHCWKFGNRMIKFDLGPADSRVSSNSDKLVLYDTENGGFIDLYARNVYTNSDAASKTNIQSLGSATATLTQLRPVSFEWADKAHYFKTSRRSTGVSNPKEMGFIAQEIEQVLPDIVAVDCEGHRVVNYSALIPLLTKSIQELNGQIETLKAEIEALKSGK